MVISLYIYFFLLRIRIKAQARAGYMPLLIFNRTISPSFMNQYSYPGPVTEPFIGISPREKSDLKRIPTEVHVSFDHLSGHQ